jgi:cytoskeletal protein CcmA (bactofilin family)
MRADCYDAQSMFASATRKIPEPQKINFESEPVSLDTKPSIPSRQGNESMNNIPTPNQSTVFSEDTELKGSLSFTTRLEFNGRFEGELLANGPLVIGEKALVRAEINATSSVVIYGKVKGNVVAKEKIELGPKAHLYGDVRSPKFMISEGAVFIGRVDTLEGGAKPSDEFNTLFRRLNSKGGASEIDIPSKK